MNALSTKQESLRKVKQNAAALSLVSLKLKTDISFAWDISRIQSEMNDEIRKKYFIQFMFQESLKLFISLATVVISCFIIVGVIVLPIPFLAAVTFGSLLAAISGFYAMNKIVQHVKGCFQVSEGIDILQQLPEAILCQTEAIAGGTQLALASETMYSIFHKNNLNPLWVKFLQCVAFGKQDKVEQLFGNVFSNHAAKIQVALCYQGRFTDYSGRTFNCTAYEYAYWAKDTHMCRMLEAHMDEDTKTQMLARITINHEFRTFIKLG